MRITKNISNGQIIGYTLWLSQNDTWKWARRPNHRWPCSKISTHRIRVEVDNNGLCNLTRNGRIWNCWEETELSACVSDHLPAECQHLWPNWKV